jgi:hypothetical protein
MLSNPTGAALFFFEFVARHSAIKKKCLRAAEKRGD